MSIDEKRMKRSNEDHLYGSSLKKVRGVNDDKIEENEILNNTKIHPLLQINNKKGNEKEDNNNTDDDDNKNNKNKIKNPILNSDWKHRREGFIINPYINQNDFSIVPERKKILLKINEPGKFIERGKIIREKLKEERIENAKQEKLKELNLIPNYKIGEELYENEFKESPPYIEWWDIPFLRNGDKRGIKYINTNKENVNYKDEDSEDNPITSYIQHPVPIEAPWTRLIPQPKPLFLTKKEMKRLRRNRRMNLMKEKQDKIKLGLEPIPKPKVKLKNLMNVLTNETIKNPTEVEMRVRREIQEREDQHNLLNKERKLNKEERKEKNERKNEEDKKRGLFRCIFKINRLVNPKHKYKINMNAIQLMIKGVCLNYQNGKSLIITEGGFKSIEKFKKLMLRRINWKENEIPKRIEGEDFELEDLKSNECELLWEGEITEGKFQKWSIYDYENEQEIIEFLDRFGMENYWRQINLI